MSLLPLVKLKISLVPLYELFLLKYILTLMNNIYFFLSSESAYNFIVV